MTLIHNFDPYAPKATLDKKVSSQERFATNRNRIRVLIFLQNEKLQIKLTESLTLRDEFMFHVSTDLSECVTAATKVSYQILLTDLCNLDLDLGEALAKIRDVSLDLAVMALIPEADHLKEIECLNHGVDCVLSEPLNISLMTARIKALMRWRNIKEQSSSEIGPFVFEMQSKRLCSNQFEDVRLTDKETRILRFLLSQKGNIVSRTDLLKHVWGYNNSANTHTVETHIYRLRKKIGTITDSKSIIITEAGGYKLAK